MIEILNLENLIPPEAMAKLSDSAVVEVLYNIADGARSEWIRLAQQEFFTTKRDYIAGIQPVRIAGKNTAIISLVGMLPNLLEKGMDRVDMHDTLLGDGVPIVSAGGRGKKRSKHGGFYRSVPFRHGTPGSGGGPGQPMGRPYRGHEAVADAKKLGKSVYGMAKGLTATTSEPGKGVAYGGRLRSPIGKTVAPKLRPYHATNIYEGMIREEKTYKRGTQSQYTTFRTIAVDAQGNPSPEGASPWIRPKTEGRFLAKQVRAFVQKIAAASFTAYLESDP